MLDAPDGVWAGDYWVKYWMPEWQKIIYGTPDSYLDRILALGYDGVYLDRVDAYWYYQDQGRTTAAREMVDFVLDFTRYTREKHPGFGIFPQNAEDFWNFRNLGSRERFRVEFLDSDEQAAPRRPLL